MVAREQIPREHLLTIKQFLVDVSETNEDTKYDPDQEDIVQAIINLAKSQGKTSVVEDFEVVYVHPMITIQKWNKELLELVNDLLSVY